MRSHYCKIIELIFYCVVINSIVLELIFFIVFKCALNAKIINIFTASNFVFWFLSVHFRLFGEAQEEILQYIINIMCSFRKKKYSCRLGDGSLYKIPSPKHEDLS